MTSATSKELDAYARAGAIAQEVLSSIRTVVAFGGQDKECLRYNANLSDARKFGVKKTTASGAGMGVIYFIMFACYALAFWYGSKLVREEEAYTAGVMLTVSQVTCRNKHWVNYSCVGFHGCCVWSLRFGQCCS